MLHQPSRAVVESEPAGPAALTPAERAALRDLRERYRETGDLFSARELEHLRFVRWCRAHGRLAGDEPA
ncbi:MAG TPA: hypothetical protein VFN57_13070 [Thermomicrobiaceae bacterium]|nr:hypothetical protein [Thermomicrobiaceae bacterium]